MRYGLSMDNITQMYDGESSGAGAIISASQAPS